MNKKDVLFPAVLVGASIIFIFVSMAVWLSKGQSKKWISRKIKIGAFILSLSSMAACSQPQITCYDVAPLDNFQFKGTQNDIVVVNPDSSTNINGQITGRQAKKFSFNITDEKNHILYKDNIFAKDNSYDSIVENFEFQINKNIPDGKYFLHLFSTEKENQDSIRFATQTQELKIIRTNN